MPKIESLQHVAIIGTFDVANYGDCLFPFLVEKLLSEVGIIHETTLWSPTSRGATQLHRRPVGHLYDLEQELKSHRYNFIIFAGGQTVTFGHTRGTYSHLLPWRLPSGPRMWGLTAHLSAKSRVPLLFCSLGVDPIPDRDSEALRYALSVPIRVSTRDSVSQDHLRSRGIDADLVPDIIAVLPAVMSVDDASRRISNLSGFPYEAEKYIAAQISPGYIGSRLASWCDQIHHIAKECDCPVALLPVCHFLHDTDTLRKAKILLERSGTECTLVENAPYVFDTAAVLACARFVVASSMHAALTAAVYGRSVACFAGKKDSKHERVFTSLGWPQYVTSDLDQISTIAVAVEPPKSSSVTEHALRLKEWLADSMLQRSEPPGGNLENKHGSQSTLAMLPYHNKLAPLQYIAFVRAHTTKRFPNTV